jgi:hypothetical protein
MTTQAQNSQSITINNNHDTVILIDLKESNKVKFSLDLNEIVQDIGEEDTTSSPLTEKYVGDSENDDLTLPHHDVRFVVTEQETGTSVMFPLTCSVDGNTNHDSESSWVEFETIISPNKAFFHENNHYRGKLEVITGNKYWISPTGFRVDFAKEKPFVVAPMIEVAVESLIKPNTENLDLLSNNSELPKVKDFTVEQYLSAQKILFEPQISESQATYDKQQTSNVPSPRKRRNPDKDPRREKFKNKLKLLIKDAWKTMEF